MRYVTHLAALLGLLAVAAAVGDWASGPNVLGAVGLLALVVVLALALSRLYRPGGVGSRRPAAKRRAGGELHSRELKAQRGHSSDASAPSTSAPEPAEPLWLDDSPTPESAPRRPRGPSRPAPTADAGWGAQEAEIARERGRGRHRR